MIRAYDLTDDAARHRSLAGSLLTKVIMIPSSGVRLSFRPISSPFRQRTVCIINQYNSTFVPFCCVYSTQCGKHLLASFNIYLLYIHHQHDYYYYLIICLLSRFHLSSRSRVNIPLYSSVIVINHLLQSIQWRHTR